jgi:hypothetical protein
MRSCSSSPYKVIKQIMAIQREHDKFDESESSSAAAFFSKREHQNNAEDPCTNTNLQPELLDDYSTSSGSLSSSVDQDADLDLDTCLHTLDLDLSYHNYDFSPSVAEQDTCFPTCDSSEANQGCFVGDSSSQRGISHHKSDRFSYSIDGKDKKEPDAGGFISNNATNESEQLQKECLNPKADFSGVGDSILPEMAQGKEVDKNILKGRTKTTNEGHTNGGRKVQFSTIEIRQYSITVGDNPGGRCGPPISLDWNYYNISKMNLSNYENCRGPRRNKSELYIPSKERMWTLLKEVGCSMEEIGYASSVAESIRKGRLEKESHEGCMISIVKKILRVRIR